MAITGSKTALFLIHRFIVGGVETLMARLAGYLTNTGWNVVILTGEVAAGAEHIPPKNVPLLNAGAAFHDLSYHAKATALVRHHGLQRIDFIFTGDPWSCRLGTILSTVLPERPPLLCGVYQPDEYFYPPQSGFFRSSFGWWLRSRNFDRNVPDNSKLFIYEHIRELHSLNFGRALDGARIMRLPIDGSTYVGVVRRPERHRIVSVARLTHWKTYNLYMIPIVKSLAAKGYPVHWDVYGDGEARAEMEQLALEHGVTDRVHFHGTLPYDRLPEVLAHAGVFVGMGTVMLEAAFCQVPTIPAIARTPDALTYGYVYDLPSGCTGELQEAPATVSVEQLIERLFNMNDEEYAAEMSKSHEHARPHDLRLVCAELMPLVAGAKPGRMPLWQALAYRWHDRYLQWRATRKAAA